MQTELLLLSNKLARLLVRQNFSRLDYSIHVVVSTYTSVSVTKGLRIFMDQKIIPMCFVKGQAQCGCDVNGKDGDSLLLVGFCICTSICTKPLSTKCGDERNKRDTGKGETPLCSVYAFAHSQEHCGPLVQRVVSIPAVATSITCSMGSGSSV